MLIEKYLQQKELTPSEKTYVYSTITKKVEALGLLKKEYYIIGKDMIPERVKKAQEILKGMNGRKAFISGSFLYKKEYNDIDIFVIENRRKSYRVKNKHFTCITEKDLSQPIFASAMQYSIATFPALVPVNPKKEKFEDILFLYQWLINQILNKEDQKELRDLIFQHSLYINNGLMDPRSLDLQVQEVKNLSPENRIKKINQITKEILIKIFSVRYLSSSLSDFIKTVKKMGEEYKTDNIPIFLNFAKEVQYECRTAQG